MKLKNSFYFWSANFKYEFSPLLREIVDVLENRLLPTFDGIKDEAEAVYKVVLAAGPANEDEDPADLAEAAGEARISHYIFLDEIKQSMINLFAIALYHAFEQQLLLFLRQEMPIPEDITNNKFLNIGEFKKRIKSFGIDITQFSSWDKVDELRLLANTAKHAEGTSAKDLRALRPNLFEYPQSISHISSNSIAPYSFMPLAGEDLYVSTSDLRRYLDHLLKFWEELIQATKNS